jgi:hypothetical protein
VLARVHEFKQCGVLRSEGHIRTSECLELCGAAGGGVPYGVLQGLPETYEPLFGECVEECLTVFEMTPRSTVTDTDVASQLA